MSVSEDRKPLMVLMDRQFERACLSRETALDLRNIDEAGWKLVLSECTAIDLRMYHLTAESLVGINGLRRTVRLAIEWAPKISSLSPVFRMGWLQRLYISDARSIRNIEGIEALQNLTDLHLSGNLGSLHPPLHLASIKPIARLRNLEKPELLNLKLEDDDVACIASLTSLKDLSIYHRFERKQLAFLAKRLNPQLKAPIAAYIETHVPCSECGTPLCVFTGRRMPILCRACNPSKFENLAREFEKLQEN
jgi:hypothetical protein